MLITHFIYLHIQHHQRVINHFKFNLRGCNFSKFSEGMPPDPCSGGMLYIHLCFAHYEFVFYIRRFKHQSSDCKDCASFSKVWIRLCCHYSVDITNERGSLATVVKINRFLNSSIWMVDQLN